MLRWLRIVSLVLAAIWLPATQHCALEAAGLIQSACENDGCASGTACVADACQALETAQYHANVTVLKIPAPPAHPAAGPVFALLDETAQARAPLPGFRRNIERRDWVATWHFVSRAALPPRAPTVSCV